MSKIGFGEHLRREREMRGVSLDEICAATRISTRFLQALEAEQWEILPGGVFNRGFVRAVARYLGLDEEGTVAEYAMAMSEHAPPPAWTRPEPPPATKDVNWLAWAGALLIVMLAAGGWLAWRTHVRRRAQQVAAEEATEQTPAARAAAQAATPGTSSIPVDPNATPAGADETAQGAIASGGASADSGLQLKIEAGKATTVSVAGDGGKLFDGDMIAGQSRTFSAQNELTVSAGDGGALLLQLNGQTLPPIGPPGRAGKVTLTRHSLKPAAGGAD